MLSFLCHPAFIQIHMYSSNSNSELDLGGPFVLWQRCQCSLWPTWPPGLGSMTDDWVRPLHSWSSSSSFIILNSSQCSHLDKTYLDFDIGFLCRRFLRKRIFGFWYLISFLSCLDFDICFLSYLDFDIWKAFSHIWILIFEKLSFIFGFWYLKSFLSYLDFDLWKAFSHVWILIFAFSAGGSRQQPGCGSAPTKTWSTNWSEGDWNHSTDDWL